MPRRPGATGATGATGAVAGVVAVDADASAGLGRAPPGAPPLPRPFPMVGVATGGPVAGGAAAATLSIAAAPQRSRSAEAPPKALAMPRITPPIMPPDLGLGALPKHTASEDPMHLSSCIKCTSSASRLQRSSSRRRICSMRLNSSSFRRSSSSSCFSCAIMPFICATCPLTISNFFAAVAASPGGSRSSEKDSRSLGIWYLMNSCIKSCVSLISLVKLSSGSFSNSSSWGFTRTTTTPKRVLSSCMARKALAKACCSGERDSMASLNSLGVGMVDKSKGISSSSLFCTRMA
mmetsp:Transcript_65462/g.107668  ORF Transcript_65462/g.107668 Transcript_65462/m.107668 type:complete len:292 (+) Transcript_65462:613-1488(+)